MRAAAFDLDGTLLTQNSSFAFCRYLYRRGQFSLLDFLFCLFTYIFHRFFGASLYWLHAQVFNRLFRRRKVEALQPFLKAFLDESLEKLLYFPAMEALQQCRNRGDMLLILSSSPSFIVGEVAKRLGVSRWYATEYRVDCEGVLCDIGELMDGERKARILGEYTQGTIAYSDSILDLPFLQAAALQVVVRPDRALAKVAKKNGWERI